MSTKWERRTRNDAAISREGIAARRGGEGKGKEGERERIGGNGDDGVMPSLQLLSVFELDFLISVTGLAKFVSTNWLHFT